MARVAALLAGWQKAEIDGANLRDMLLRPLRADAIVHLTFHKADGCNSIGSCMLRERLASLGSLAKLSLEPMPSLGSLLRLLEALPHWPKIIRAFNHTLHWRRYHHRGSRPRFVQCSRDRSWRDGDERIMDPAWGMYKAPCLSWPLFSNGAYLESHASGPPVVPFSAVRYTLIRRLTCATG